MVFECEQISNVRMAQKPRTWRKTYLRDYRTAAGLSLESAAAQMGLTHGQLSKIERGLHPYSQKVLETAALEYGCTVLDLLGRAPSATSSVTPKKRQPG